VAFWPKCRFNYQITWRLGVDAVPYLVLTFAPEWASRQARAVWDLACARFTVQYDSTIHMATWRTSYAVRGTQILRSVLYLFGASLFLFMEKKKSMLLRVPHNGAAHANLRWPSSCPCLSSAKSSRFHRAHCCYRYSA
jgi:hypothetical protein